MPFDPTKPTANSPNSSAEMRAQLNALHEEIASIPQGPQGEPGPPGADGAQGPAGADGSPGEVTNAALNEAIAGTARNPLTVPLLNITISDPPQQAEVQAIVDAYNLLVTSSQRQPT